MKILMTKDLADTLLMQPENNLKIFISAINRIKDLNKTQLLALESIVPLSRKNNIDYYAYEISNAIYVLFTFRPKKTMILVDIMRLTDDGKLEFLLDGSNTGENET